MEENEKSFKTVPNPNTYKNYTTEPKQKTKIGFTKSILVPFLSGVVGCTVVLGTCFGIPAIRSKIVGEGVSNTGLNANLQNSRLC